MNDLGHGEFLSIIFNKIVQFVLGQKANFNKTQSASTEIF